MANSYFDYPLYNKRCIGCPFISWEMVDAGEVAPYCDKWKKYADSEIKECKKK